MQFENLAAPAPDVALSHIEMAGRRLDLHQQFRLVGLTYSAEHDHATLGWSVVSSIRVVRGARALPLEGLVFHFVGLGRFEIAFERPAGALEYFEFRHDPEPMILWFFEGGTIRVSAQSFRADFVVAGDNDDSDMSGADTSTPIVQ